MTLPHALIGYSNEVFGYGSGRASWCGQVENYCALAQTNDATGRYPYGERCVRTRCAVAMDAGPAPKTFVAFVTRYDN